MANTINTDEILKYAEDLWEVYHLDRSREDLRDRWHTIIEMVSDITGEPVIDIIHRAVALNI